jgi:hypothetical protein
MAPEYITFTNVAMLAHFLQPTLSVVAQGQLEAFRHSMWMSADEAGRQE